jgi:hypothetical protein
MSFYAPSRLLPKRFRRVLASFLDRPDLPFADTLTEASIGRAFDEEGVSFADDEGKAVYTPAITLWGWLSQVLFKGEQGSCRAAVARIVVLLVVLGRQPCSANTGAYCRARIKLSEPVIRRLAVEVAEGCEQQVAPEWLWHGRHVHLADGFTFSMPDTEDNQREYPQSRSQKKGVGFPIARAVVLLSLATAMAEDLAIGTYAGKEASEMALLRQLLAKFKPGDILLADRYYCSYFIIALLMALGVDCVVRLHQCRKADFRRGRRLGKGDHIVQWMRPAKPKWMDQQTYDRMPASIEVREVHVHVNQPGFRVQSLVVVTTLTDADEYPAKDIAELYGHRWLVELDIRAIKATMGMDVLRCKTPEMVRKEMWTFLLAYNLIRRALLQAASKAGASPRKLSFCAALQTLAAGWQTLATCDDAMAARLVEAELANLAKETIGDRPGRVEPRAIKRRPKPHDLLTKPRAEARAELLKVG